MCGIAGVVWKSGAADPVTIRTMMDVAAHRGPDGSGQIIWRNVSLGHRRLSILDLSEAGCQPMEFGDGRYSLTYNGEIYNYVELREELEREGAVFRSHTDSEVILAAYQRWGEACLHRLNGMWAFALLDREQGTLFCARDRYGVKPFYFVDTDKVFAFGSEIKQLLPFLPHVRANRPVLTRFLITGLLEYGDETFFEGVRRLPGGHTLLIDSASPRPAPRRFYELLPTDTGDAGEAELTAKFSDLFDSAVRLRLRSDVPVGTCLSGGLDSSAIAITASAFAKRAGAEQFTAITACSIDPRKDETPFAREVVEAGHLRWLTTRPTAEEAEAARNRMLYHQEEPVPSGSPIMQYMVMKIARENGIPVLLDGQGADETLLGYVSYQSSLGAHYVRKGKLIQALNAILAVRHQEGARAMLPALAIMGEQLTPRLRARRYSRRAAYVQSTVDVLSLLSHWRDTLADFRDFQQAEILSMNLPALLRYEDKNSMAFGVETRLPFLDYRLVEFCVGLPVSMKLRGGWRKWILREAMSGKLPETIAWRKGKIGFEAPDSEWQKKGADKMNAEILDSEVLRPIVDYEKLKQMLPRLDVRSRTRLHSAAAWGSTFGVKAD